MKTSSLKVIMIVIITVVLTTIVNRLIDKKGGISEPPGSKANHIPLDSAQAHIREYTNWWNFVPDTVSVGDSLIHLRNAQIGTLAYSVDIGDIVDATVPKNDGDRETILGMLSYFKIRAYMGIDGESAHLYIVAVNEEGQDVIPSGENGSYVYDLTTPCPNSCDTESPLYTPM